MEYGVFDTWLMYMFLFKLINECLCVTLPNYPWHDDDEGVYFSTYVSRVAYKGFVFYVCFSFSYGLSRESNMTKGEFNDCRMWGVLG